MLSRIIFKISIFFLFFIFGIFFLYFSYFDTGLYYSYDYLKSKTIDNYRKNQNQIKISTKFTKEPNLLNDYIDKEGILDDSVNYISYPDENDLIENDFNSWDRSNGGNFSNKFSNYKKINKTNVNNLKLLWKYKDNKNFFIDKTWKNNVEINPIFYDGLIYTTTPYKEILALDALTGNLVWKFKSLKEINARGMTFWYNKNDPKNSCLFVPIRDSIFCINYKTGKRIKSFGSNGFVKAGIVRAAPVIWNNSLIIATLDTLKIKSFSLEGGNFLWEIPIHPVNKNFKGGTPWGGISLDPKRGLLFVSTGNPRPALYGGTRKGDNKNANSLVVFDLINRDIKWSFQEVAHDLWDYDIASPPLLSSIKLNDEIIDVVIVMTKIGNTFVFTREEGTPLYSINYKNAPVSNIINEMTAKKQIDVDLPKSTIKFKFDIEDLDDRNLEYRNNIIDNLDKYTFGWFEPPSLEKILLLYGLHGGAQWPGGSFDPYTQNLYVPVNQIPWKIKMFISSDEDPPEDNYEIFKLYKNKCSSCHLSKRNGIYKTAKEKEIRYVPSLIDIYNKKFPSYEIFYSKLRNNHEINISDSQIKKLFKFFNQWDNKILRNNSEKINFQWSQFIYPDNLPANSPPWGKIVSLNLKNGSLNWEVPNGYIGDKKVGTSNFGGILVSKGKIVVATGTDDNKVVALSAENGNELWSYEMDSAGSTSPMTFLWKNKQILIVVASGGKYHNYKKKSGTIYAFSLD